MKGHHDLYLSQTLNLETFCLSLSLSLSLPEDELLIVCFSIGERPNAKTERLSYPTETVLSNKITRNWIVLSLKDSPRKLLRRRPSLFPLFFLLRSFPWLARPSMDQRPHSTIDLDGQTDTLTHNTLPPLSEMASPTTMIPSSLCWNEMVETCRAQGGPMSSPNSKFLSATVNMSATVNEPLSILNQEWSRVGFLTLGLVKYCALPTYSGQENANFHPDSPNPASQIPRLLAKDDLPSRPTGYSGANVPNHKLASLVGTWGQCILNSVAFCHAW